MSTASRTASGTNAPTGSNAPASTGPSSWNGQGGAAAGIFAPSAAMSMAALCGSVFLGFAVFL